jgi:hypothetical protein
MNSRYEFMQILRPNLSMVPDLFLTRDVTRAASRPLFGHLGRETTMKAVGHAAEEFKACRSACGREARRGGAARYPEVLERMTGL